MRVAKARESAFACGVCRRCGGYAVAGMRQLACTRDFSLRTVTGKMSVKSKQTKRFYETSEQDLVDFAGEDPLGFELLRTQLAEAYAPDGLDEENCIYQMAKSLFLKRDLPTKRSRMKVVTEAETLNKFNDLLLANASESKIESALDSFRGELIDELRRRYPRRNYDSTEEWIEALKQVIFCEFMGRAIAMRYQEEQQPQEPAPGHLLPEMLERERAYEKQLDESYDHALDRLFKIKARKRQITFWELQRFDRTHPERLAGVEEPKSHRSAIRVTKIG
jgi:hypothetical protein